MQGIRQYRQRNRKLPIAALVILSALLLVPTGTVDGRIISVPADAPTIQAGLDSLGQGDTLFVSLGTYEEFVIAPPLAFALIGELLSDSGEVLRPILDPSRLEAADTMAALSIPYFASARIENFEFRHSGRHGVRGWADSVRIVNCVFDEMVDGIRHVPDSLEALIELKDCEFRGLSGRCVSMRAGNCLSARHCLFHGVGDSETPVVSSVCSSIDSCTFSSTGRRTLLACTFGPHTISNCVFGPVTTLPSREVVYLSDGAIQFEGNAFADCNYGYHALYVSSSEGDSVRIAGNTFVRCRGLDTGLAAQGVVGLATPGDLQHGALISGNSFVECSGVFAVDDISTSVTSPVRIFYNRFERDSLNGLPSIVSGNWWQETPALLRDNHFASCGYALDGSASTDARFNYWGHTSGPFQETLNPSGLGDTLTGVVQFVPWSTDSVATVSEQVEAAPTLLSLAAHPNPFNGSTLFTFSLERASHVKLRVFDILGREISTLPESVYAAGRQQVSVDMSGIASGVYFVHLSTARANAVTKLVLLR